MQVQVPGKQAAHFLRDPLDATRSFRTTNRNLIIQSQGLNVRSSMASTRGRPPTAMRGTIRQDAPEEAGRQTGWTVRPLALGVARRGKTRQGVARRGTAGPSMPRAEWSSIIYPRACAVPWRGAGHFSIRDSEHTCHIMQPFGAQASHTRECVCISFMILVSLRLVRHIVIACEARWSGAGRRGVGRGERSRAVRLAANPCESEISLALCRSARSAKGG